MNQSHPTVSMTPEDSKARLFISCGQNEESDERKIASAISSRLRELGFDPYVAVADQSPRGVRENIFAQLESSEYFIFIDFKREPLEPGGMARGSLFSNQELAVASFLNIPILAFQEDGVIPRDGMIGSLQLNCYRFKDRATLKSVIVDEIVRRKWDARSQNKLALERNEEEDSNITWTQTGRMARFFYIGVRNRHHRKVARNCSVFLTHAINLNDDKKIVLKPTELKWSGFLSSNAHIPPNCTRQFDAFWFHHDTPTKLEFSALTDNKDFPARINPGRYKFTYSVVSDNFPQSESTYSVVIGDTLDQHRLTDYPT